MSAPTAQRHQAWLELLQTSGPFLTVPVLARAWPDGLPRVPTPVRARIRAGLDELISQRGATRLDFIRGVLCDLLDWQDRLVWTDNVPASMAAPVAEHGLLLRPDFGFAVDDNVLAADEPDPYAGDIAEPGDDDSSTDGDESTAAAAGRWRLLGQVCGWAEQPLTRTARDGWVASPVERLAVLLRHHDVPLGLVTGGRWWALVYAPRGAVPAVAVWDASLWSEEPETLQAFAALLERARFLGVADRDRLPALFAESLLRQEEITEGLGRQVREAVELLVDTLVRLDRDSNGRVLTGVDNEELYAGVVTVMMRVVFLLFAEERRLLPSDDDLYADSYAVGRLVERLESDAQLLGEQALEHRTGAWHQLLATARAVHRGLEHEDVRMPAYGGGLVDPDRHPWLEGRTGPDDSRADRVPPAVDDLTVLRMLTAVQYVQVGPERRRLTFRALDVEQVGFCYEGLLELEVRTAGEPIVGLPRPRDWPRGKEPPEVPLSELLLAASNRSTFPKWVADRSRLSAASAGRLLTGPPDPALREAVARAVDGDADLVAKVAPIAALLRTTGRGLPAVWRTGDRYVAPSRRRASSGTHYTPRSLAEEIVTGALEPLVYRPGPLDTHDRARWRLRPSEHILGLRVADISMGSGAFLVAACRFLADRLVEAWDAEGRDDAEGYLAGRTSAAADAEVDPVVLDARRQVAERCLFGADINVLAVETAKLSLWLITMDRERPFGFLDARLVVGDSLLGLVDLRQLEELHVDPAQGRQLRAGLLPGFETDLRPLLQEAADLRRRISAHPTVTIRDAEHKARLLQQADELTADVVAVADAVVAAGLTPPTVSPAALAGRFRALHSQVAEAARTGGLRALGETATAALEQGRPPNAFPRRPLHWPIAFPEVFVDADRPGMDALIGNPPFLGGQKIREAFGDDYLAWLQRFDGRGVRGSADLVARFVLRADRLLSDRGQLGIIATNTLVQGSTLEVGLQQLVERERLHVLAGRSSHKWPSASANLQIVDVWASRPPVRSDLRWLDGDLVPSITVDLDQQGRVHGRPQRLAENEGLAFIGSYVLGLGFTMSPEEAAGYIAADTRNADVLRPYVIGKDLNQRPDTSGSRQVINFRDWSLDRAERYPVLIDRVRRLVKPERDRNNRENYRRFWWRYGETRPGLYAAIEDLDHVLAVSLVGSTLQPARVPTGAVFAHKCCVFALPSPGDLALLASSVHQVWVIRYTSTLRTDINYSPSDVFDTFPRPESTTKMRELGGRLDQQRRHLMLSRGWGLTTTYNHVHDPADRDPEVQALRELHAEVDRAVLAAYGWEDLDLQVGHHPTKIGVRWTVSPAARFELLDRLLEENLRRAALQARARR